MIALVVLVWILALIIFPALRRVMVGISAISLLLCSMIAWNLMEQDGASGGSILTMLAITGFIDYWLFRYAFSKF